MPTPVEEPISVFRRYAVDYAKALGAYAEFVGKWVPVPAAALPAAVVRRLEGIGAEASGVFAFLAGVSAIASDLDGAAAAALDPQVFTRAVREFSESHENDALTAKRLLERGRERFRRKGVDPFFSDLPRWGAALAKELTAEETRAGLYQEGGGRLLVLVAAHAVPVWRSSGGGGVAELAECLKNLSLGAPPDTPQSIADSLEARRGVLPLQAMESFFGLAPTRTFVAPPAEGAAAAIDATLPRTSAVYSYHFKSMAAAGKLFQQNAGVDEAAIADTVFISARPAGAPRPAHTIPAPPETVVRTCDGGGSYEALEPQYPAKDYTLAGAGMKPRVGRVGEILGRAVFRREAAVRAFDSKRLLAGEASAAPFIAKEALLRAVHAAFVAEYAERRLGAADASALFLSSQPPDFLTRGVVEYYRAAFLKSAVRALDFAKTGYERVFGEAPAWQQKAAISTEAALGALVLSKAQAQKLWARARKAATEPSVAALIQGLGGSPSTKAAKEALARAFGLAEGGAPTGVMDKANKLATGAPLSVYVLERADLLEIPAP